jgi:hypothetical protein
LSFINNRDKFTGYLMSKDIIIGEILADEIVNINEELIRNVAECVTTEFNGVAKINNEFDIDYIVKFCMEAYHKLMKTS